MGKDPAFLFYPGDWLGGTMFFTRTQKGAYMDLLVAQFHTGRMSILQIQTILGNDFDSMWEQVLKPKYHKDRAGLFYNKRLEEEQLKRQKHSNHQRNKALKRWNRHESGTQSGNAPALPLEDENENESTNENKDKDKDRIPNVIVRGVFHRLNLILHPQKPCKESPEYFNKIRTRLKRYSTEELLLAASNVIKNPHMMGTNEGGRKYATLEYITRDDKNVQKWLESGQGKLSATEYAQTEEFKELSGGEA